MDNGQRGETQMPWPYGYDSCPPKDDDNDYVWNRLSKRWELCIAELSSEEEDALERHEERRRKRIEWEAYHPGEPCPKCELE